jgi:hypothetical protein
MKVASTNNVKVYTVAGEGVRSLPEWLIRQKKHALRHDPGEKILFHHQSTHRERLPIENRTDSGL